MPEKNAIVADWANPDWTKVDRKLRSSIREAGLSRGSQARYDAYCIAFLKWVEKRGGKALGYDNVAQKLMLEYDIDKLSADAVEQALKNTGWNEKSEPTAKKVFAEEALTSYLLNVPILEGSLSLASLSALALQILDVNPGESVLDLECGAGSFLSQVATREPSARLHGFDIDERAVTICQMRATVALSLAAPYGITRPEGIRAASAFDDIVRQTQYDKIFSNHPFGIGLERVEGDSKLLMQLKKEADPRAMHRCAEWAFCRVLVESLSEGGKGVAIMSDMAVSNPMMASAREYFVRSGLIEGVISLPERSGPRSGVSQTLVVLSRGNTGIRFIDASSIALLDDKAAVIISEAWHGCTAERSLPEKAASVDELAKRLFNLNPAALMLETRSGTPLGELCEAGIRRGLPVHNELVEADPEDEGACLYLRQSDVVDGRIATPQMGLPWPDQAKAHKFALREGDLLVSRSGAPDKVAVAEGLDGKIIVPSDNFYAVTLDKNEVDPWYAAAFLNSPAGENALRRAGAGSHTRVISLAALREIEIPIIDITEQGRIAASWKERLDRISKLRAELESATANLHEGLWG